MTEEFRGTDGVYRMLFEPEEFEYIEAYLDRSLEQTSRAQPRCASDADAAVRVIEAFYNRLLLNPIAAARQSFGTVPSQYVGGAWAPSSLVPAWLDAVNVFDELIETDCFGLAPMPDFDEIPLEDDDEPLDDEEPMVFPGLGIIMHAYPITGTTPKDEEDLTPDVEPGSFGIQGTASSSSGNQGLVVASVALTAVVGIGWLLLRKS